MTAEITTAQWAAILHTFHQVFPTHVGVKRRKAMFDLAKQLLLEEIKPEAQQVERAIETSVHRKTLKAADVGVILFLWFIAQWVWVMVQPMQEITPPDPMARQRFFEELFDRFEQVQTAPSEELWPFRPPPAPVQVGPVPQSEHSQARNPSRKRSELSASPTPAPRKPAKRHR
jgi:hypothetical protein